MSGVGNWVTEMKEGGIEGELAVSFLTGQVSSCCTHMNMIKKESGVNIGLFKGWGSVEMLEKWRVGYKISYIYVLNLTVTLTLNP